MCKTALADAIAPSPSAGIELSTAARPTHLLLSQLDRPQVAAVAVLQLLRHAVLGDWGLSRQVKENAAARSHESHANGEGKAHEAVEIKRAGDRWAGNLDNSSAQGYVKCGGSFTPWPWTALLGKTGHHRRNLKTMT